MSVRIIVDSTADLRPEVKERVKIVPLTVHFGDKEYRDGVDMDYVKFYEELTTNENHPTTSQPNPVSFEEAYEEVTAAGDDAIVITISSKLSGTCQSANIAAGDFDNVYVVDSETAAIGTGVLVEYAYQLADAGMDAKEIVEKLNVEKKKVKIVALVDTLEYLQKGGRISKAVAIAGGLISLKPIISVEGGVINTAGKARGLKKGFQQIGAIAETLGDIDYLRPHMLGFTGMTSENLDKYEEAYDELWTKEDSTYGKAAIGSAIGTHVGPGAVAAAYFVK